MHSVVTVSLLLLAFIAPSEGLSCNVMNTIQGLFVQQCPGNINQCMKFDCNVRGSKQTFKGCNDPANPAVACQVLQQNCMNQGGQGQCHTCNFEMCNSSRGGGAVAAVLLALGYYFTANNM